jgi:hypothetical protein
MSGGHWGYRSYRLEERAQEIKPLLEAVAKTEHIVDWAVCGDTLRADAARELFELWETTFEALYGDDGPGFVD